MNLNITTRKVISLSIMTGALLALPSCKDAADATTDATVSDAAPEAKSVSGEIYEFTKNSTIGFVGSKITDSHEGGFKDFSGSFTLKDGKPEAGEFTIQMDSTWSDSEKLTGHLKAADFFDVATYPETKFTVTSFTTHPDKKVDVSGNLLLHGVTKNITFPAEVSNEGGLFRVVATFDIDRKDFGIVYPGRPDDLIRDRVVIKFNLEAKPKS